MFYELDCSTIPTDREQVEKAATFMNASRDPTPDKVGEALNAQRFQMIKDIAKELAGDVVFPTCFDTAFRLRQELQNPDLPISRISSIVSLEPLIAAKLMELANSAFYRVRGMQALDVQAAINRLGVDLVRTTALAIAMRQLMRSKEMVVFRERHQPGPLEPFPEDRCGGAHSGAHPYPDQPGRSPAGGSGSRSWCLLHALPGSPVLGIAQPPGHCEVPYDAVA